MRKVNKYPAQKVILGYALLGGIVGTMVVNLYSIIYEVFAVGKILDAMFYPHVFFVGWLVGFIPALMTGIWIAWRKMSLKSPTDLVKCFAIGCVCTFIFYFLFFVVFIFILDRDWARRWFSVDQIVLIMPYFLFLGLVGGVSSVILAFLLLPKREKNE